jgi:hypothetical protein
MKENGSSIDIEWWITGRIEVASRWVFFVGL